MAPRQNSPLSSNGSKGGSGSNDMDKWHKKINAILAIGIDTSPTTTLITPSKSISRRHSTEDLTSFATRHDGTPILLPFPCDQNADAIGVMNVAEADTQT
jgi:hypothetical protein